MNTVAIDQNLVREVQKTIEDQLDLTFVHTRSINKSNVRHSRLFQELHDSDNRKYCLKIYTAQAFKAYQEGFERYESIYRSVSDELKINLAEPILHNERNGIFYSFESYIEGDPLKSFLEKRLISFTSKEKAISQCLKWLTRFKKSFDSIAVNNGDLLANLEQYRELFDCSAEEFFLLDLLEQRIRNSTTENEYFFQHGDLSVENVLINEAAFGIFDWELTGSESIPHHDFFVFLTTGIYSIERCFDKNRENGFRRIFSKNRCRTLFAESLKTYAVNMGINRDFAYLFFPYYLVTLPLILKNRRSSAMTIAAARKNAAIYALQHEEIDKLLTF